MNELIQMLCSLEIGKQIVCVPSKMQKQTHLLLCFNQKDTVLQ